MRPCSIETPKILESRELREIYSSKTQISNIKTKEVYQNLEIILKVGIDLRMRNIIEAKE